MTKVFGLCGWSGSGKTDLICRLIEFYTKRNIVVSTIKHTHHKIKIDKEGKDSYKHRIYGAHEVIVGGLGNFALIHSGLKKKEYSIAYLKNRLSKENDLILVEGFKKTKIPKIEIYNSNIKKTLIYKSNESVKAIVYDRNDKKLSNCNLPKFNFYDTRAIAKFISDFLELES